MINDAGAFHSMFFFLFFFNISQSKYKYTQYVMFLSVWFSAAAVLKGPTPKDF